MIVGSTNDSIGACCSRVIVRAEGNLGTIPVRHPGINADDAYKNAFSSREYEIVPLVSKCLGERLAPPRR